MLQQESANTGSTPQPDQIVAAGVPVPQRSRGLFSVPVIGGLCCLGLILFLIAATIVLSLIPVYLSARNTAPRQTTQVVVIQLASGSNILVGPLNAQQRASLQSQLQAELNANPQTQGTTVQVVEATAANNGRRKRRQNDFATFINAVLIFIGPAPLRALTAFFRNFILPLAVALEIRNEGSPTTTTITPTTAAVINGTRSLVRRSLEESGAPAGIVYIDAHEIATTKGLVSSVSIYVDRSCALSTIEFGAFDLLDRFMETNNAELLLTHRSGAIKLGEAAEFKGYMSLITIPLCTPGATVDAYGRLCKGVKFPVQPHQYVGVRSDSCRLGFAPTPVNPLAATTWKPADKSDPFAAPYETVTYVPSDYTVLQSIIIEPTEPQLDQKTKEEKSTKNDAPRVLFIGSYPPRRCGLAKFLEDLTDIYKGDHNIIAVDEHGVDVSSRTYPEKVIDRLNQTDRDAYFKLANISNSRAYDIINLQHEYGLFGGYYGEYILHYLSSVRKPVVTTLHTVIPNPEPFAISVTRAVCALSTRVVVLADLGRRLLIDVYGVDEAKIVVIPHGVPDMPFDQSLVNAKTKLGLDPNVPTMITFGLIHRNKNIQLALQAMESVVKSVPNMMYLVVGETHPLIKKYEGEAYRTELQSNVSSLGLTNNVRFIDKFVDNSELINYLGGSDIFLTPYAREDQYVSGTLSWAVGLGKVVISTPYLYAKELLADGRGFLVPFNDPASMSSTIVKTVQDENVRNVARRHAYKHGRQMAWPHVANDLEDLFHDLILFA